MATPAVTVIYYSSNREDSAFEDKIRVSLLDTIGDMPLISVTQQPIDFGQNICVGEVGVSCQNAWRQFQVGAIAATTPYVCSAEADFLHAPEYFRFVPPTDTGVYTPSPLYVLFAQKRNVKRFFLKGNSEGAIVCGRDYLIRTIDAQLQGRPQWSTSLESGRGFDSLFAFGPHGIFPTTIPTVTFKTDNNFHRKTSMNRHSNLTEIPYWGNAHALVRKYLA